jgi:type II secretory pathway component PulJ
MDKGKHKKKIKQKSVTLIELIIAVSIFSLVGLGVHRALSNSILVFRRIKKNNSNIDSLIFLQKLEHDLRNVFCDSVFYFEGNNSHLTFFIHRPSQNHKLTNKIIKVEYKYLPEKNGIIRRMSSYKDNMVNERLILKKVNGLSFNYYQPGNLDDLSKPVAIVEQLPYAVGFTLIIAGDKEYRAILKLPLSG